jgi:hypothetical protein
MSISGMLVSCQVDVNNVQTVAPSANCVFLSVFKLNYLMYSVPSRNSETLFLKEVVNLLRVEDVEETPVRALNDMMFISDAHTVHPVVCVSIGELVVFA